MPIKTFAESVTDVQVDEDRFKREMANSVPAQRVYVILFTPRSGSSWLTSILSDVMGFPEEYINPQFIPRVSLSTNSRDQAGLLSILKRRRKTANDVFGIEATATHITIFGEREFFHLFEGNTIFFWLWRDNLVAQGVSLYKAVTTGYFHSSEKKRPPPPTFDYDLNEVRRWINHILHIENENFRMIERRGIAPRFLRYEDIVRSKATTMAIFADAMHVDIGEQPVKRRTGKLTRVSDDWNHTVEMALREKEKNFVDELEFKRLIKAH